ncbi:MAG: hypothetical protein EB084_19345 [Proteobacteria bacterium]|nr:hypothetical protein [Pseudomonadota bacterium]
MSVDDARALAGDADSGSSRASASGRIDREILFFTLIGALLRLYRLGASSLTIDEGLSLRYALLPIGSIDDMTPGITGPDSLLQFVYRFDGHPPLFYLTLHAWLGIVGVASETVLRLPFALCSIVALHAACRLARRLLPADAARAAMALAAVSQAAVWCGQELRMYPMLAMFVLCATLCGCLAWLDDWRPGWVGWSACTAAAGYTHYLGLFSMPAFALWALTSRGRGRSWQRLALAFASCAALLLPWLPVALAQTRAGHGPPVLRGVGTERLPLAILQTFTDLVLGPSFPLSPLSNTGVAIAGGLVIGLFIAAFRLGGDRARAAVALSLSQTLVPMACLTAICVCLGRGILQPRFFMAFALFGAIALAPWGQIPAGRGLLLVVVAANVTSLATWYFNPLYQRQPFRQAAQAVLANVQPDDLVLVEDVMGIDAMRYYLPLDRAPSVAAAHPQRIDDGSLARVVRGHSRVWLVLADAWVTDPDNRVFHWMMQWGNVIQSPSEIENHDPSHTIVVMRFDARRR